MTNSGIFQPICLTRLKQQPLSEFEWERVYEAEKYAHLSCYK